MSPARGVVHVAFATPGGLPVLVVLVETIRRTEGTG